MDFVRSDNCHRIRIERRVPSVAILQSNSHLKIGRAHRGTRARFTTESSLVELVRVSAVRPRRFDLDEHQNAENGAQGLRALPFYVLLIATYFSPSGKARWDIFFVFDFRARASSVARADQIKRRGLDCVRVVDFSDFTRLGRTALAKRSAIGWPSGTTD